MTDANNSVLAGTELATQENQTLEAQQSVTGLALENAQETTPQYVTKDDLAQFGETLAKRIKQSDKDRSKHTEGEIANLKKVLDGIGVQLQPSQEQALRNKIADQLEGTENFETQAEAQTAGAEFNINNFVSELVSPYNVKVNRESPYFAELEKSISESWNDENGYPKVVKAITEYGQKEAQRLADNQNNASARVMGGGGVGQQLDSDAPASQMWKQAYRK